MQLVIKIAITWMAGLVVLIALDIIWIGVIASSFYKKQTGHLLNITDDKMVVNVPAGIAVWAVIVTGIYLFVMPRAADSGSLLAHLAWGALFGVITYGIYDLTNYALLKDWPLMVTVVDIAWGGVVCALTALCMALASRAGGHLF